MAVDFEALDLVRSQNRSRSYNKRLEGLQQQVTELGELVADAIACVVELEKSSHVGRSTTLKERFQKKPLRYMDIAMNFYYNKRNLKKSEMNF